MNETSPFARARRRLRDERRRMRTLEGGEADLSRREAEVLELLAEGCSNRAIAEILDLTVSSVTSHLHRVYKKLDLPNRPDTEQRVLAARTFWEDEGDAA